MLITIGRTKQLVQNQFEIELKVNWEYNFARKDKEIPFKEKETFRKEVLNKK